MIMSCVVLCFSQTSLMCVLTPQPAGLQLTARGTMQQRMPVASTLDRSSMAGSQPMMPYQKRLYLFLVIYLPLLVSF